MFSKKTAQLKTWIKEKSAEQLKEKTLLRKPHDELKDKDGYPLARGMQSRCSSRAIEITALLTLYAGQRGKENSHKYKKESYLLGFNINKIQKLLDVIKEEPKPEVVTVDEEKAYA